METFIVYCKQKDCFLQDCILKRDNKQPTKELLGWGSILGIGLKESWSRITFYYQIESEFWGVIHGFFFSITQALDIKQIKVGGEDTPALSSSTAIKLSTFSRLFLWSTHLLSWSWRDTIHVVLTCEITLNSTQLFYFLFVYFISVEKFNANV